MICYRPATSFDDHFYNFQKTHYLTLPKSKVDLLKKRQHQ